MEGVNNDLEMSITTDSTTTGRGDAHILEDLEVDESLPGLDHLSGEQLFFLNFAQVCNFTISKAIVRWPHYFIYSHSKISGV